MHSRATPLASAEWISKSLLLVSLTTWFSTSLLGITSLYHNGISKWCIFTTLETRSVKVPQKSQNTYGYLWCEHSFLVVPPWPKTWTHTDGSMVGPWFHGLFRKYHGFGGLLLGVRATLSRKWFKLPPQLDSWNEIWFRLMDYKPRIRFAGCTSKYFLGILTAKNITKLPPWSSHVHQQICCRQWVVSILAPEIQHVPSGKHTKNYWKWTIEIVDLRYLMAGVYHICKGLPSAKLT